MQALDYGDLEKIFGIFIIGAFNKIKREEILMGLNNKQN